VHEHIDNNYYNANYNFNTSNYDNLNTCHQLLCAHFSRLADRCVRRDILIQRGKYL
jgi:hypothetical protein